MRTKDLPNAADTVGELNQLASDILRWQEAMNVTAARLHRQVCDAASHLARLHSTQQLREGRTYTEAEAAAELKISVDKLGELRRRHPDWPHYTLPGCISIYYSDKDLAILRANWKPQLAGRKPRLAAVRRVS